MRTIITDHAKMRYMQRKNPQSQPEQEIPELFKDSREVEWKHQRNNAKFNAEHGLAFAYKKENGNTLILTVLRLNEEEINYKDQREPAKPQNVKYA